MNKQKSQEMNFMLKNRSRKEMLQILRTMQGRVPYALTNDYMFRAIFQSNLKALKGLLSAILKIPIEDILNVEILNPIELGKSITDKTTILDIRLELNNQVIINLEMQVAAQKYWVERSLLYLCRCYDNLEKGQDYGTLKKAIHIGILDFTLFEDNKALHSLYQLMDAETSYIYTGKFQLHVVDLTQLEDAAEEEKKSDLYYWAKLFKTITWEELTDMAEKSESMLETIFTLHEMTEDEKIKEQCAARERYEHDWITNYNAGREEGREEGIEAFILDNLEDGKTEEVIIAKLGKRFQLEHAEARKYFEKYASKID